MVLTVLGAGLSIMFRLPLLQHDTVNGMGLKMKGIYVFDLECMIETD